MSTNPTLLVTLAQPNPAESETFGRYVGASTELAVAAGASVGSRFGVDHIVGDAPAIVFGFASFPSATSITDMFDSDDYQALIPDREKSLDCVNAYIVDDAAITDLDEPDGVYLVTVAAPNPEAADDLVAYQQAAGPLSAKHGARPVANLAVTGHPVGDTPAAFIAIAAFPDADAVQAMFNDPDYQAVVPTRDRALASLNLYVTTA